MFNTTMRFLFSGEIFEWRGPAPHYFVTVPEEQSRDIKGIANLVTYGWGVIPVTVKIGDTEFSTSLFPKEGRYLVPIKAAVRKKEDLQKGDTVDIQLDVGGKGGMLI
jgi:hypothetical protein